MTRHTNGKVAIVTGASSGIGRVTAVSLYNAGWNVTITARRRDKLEETRQLCDADGEATASGCLIMEGDITSEEFVIDVFGKTVKKFGRLDLLFNNAGTVSPQVSIDQVETKDFQRVIDVNLTACFVCTREAFKAFKTQTPQGGRIINNGSISAHTPRPFTYGYTASKHALMGLTKCTALDGRDYNISCTQIDIGNAMTDMAYRLSVGALQPNGTTLPESTIDVKHVADTIVHIAGLPNDVQVLEFTIMPVKMPYVGRG